MLRSHYLSVSDNHRKSTLDLIKAGELPPETAKNWQKNFIESLGVSQHFPPDLSSIVFFLEQNWLINERFFIKASKNITLNGLPEVLEWPARLPYSFVLKVNRELKFAGRVITGVFVCLTDEDRTAAAVGNVVTHYQADKSIGMESSEKHLIINFPDIYDEGNSYNRIHCALSPLHIKALYSANSYEDYRDALKEAGVPMELTYKKDYEMAYEVHRFVVACIFSVLVRENVTHQISPINNMAGKVFSAKQIVL